ncbi:MAG: CehA/McbA family metallohydrolase [Candidatus Altiarchaeota archaeon]
MTLIVVISICPLLSTSEWYEGDLHIHTGYSSREGYDKNLQTEGDNCPKELITDQGYTLQELESHSKGVGLDWITVTDHSYCLDESEWETLKSECSGLIDSDFLCIIGQEVSVKEDCTSNDYEGACTRESLFTPKGVSHLGVRGHSQFIQTSPPNVWCPDSPGQQETINSVNSRGGVTIINHPSHIQYDWESSSCTSGETGVEIWNGDTPEQDDIEFWKSRLLQGDHPYGFGGTDSHDELNTKVYTSCYMFSLSESNLLSALHGGRCFVSNSHEVETKLFKNKDYTGMMGDTVTANSYDELDFDTYWTLKENPTTPRLSIYAGKIGDSHEDMIYYKLLTGSSSGGVGLPISPDDMTYYRVEIRSIDRKNTFSNPIWVEIEDINPGKTLEISATVHNVGDTDASDFEVRILDNADVIYTTTVPYLAANSSTTVSTTWTAELGVHNFHVQLDNPNTIAESDESDNSAFKTVTVTETGITVNPTGRASAEVTYTEPVEVQIQEVNDPGDTEYSIDRFIEYTANTSFEEATIRINYSEEGLDVDERTLRIHYWNETTDEWQQITRSGVNTDDDYVWADVNHFSIYTAIGEKMPELTVNLSGDNQTVPDKMLQIKTQIENTGDENASNFTIEYYDLYNNTNVSKIMETTINNLTQQEHIILTLNWNDNRTGNHTIFTIVDSLDEIEEVDESNNIGILEVEILDDEDNDYVADIYDECNGTVLPEDIDLLPNHYADVDGDRTLETNTGNNKKPQIANSNITLTDTRGCTCTQILKQKPGKDNGELRHGCTKGTTDNWIRP